MDFLSLSLHVSAFSYREHAYGCLTFITGPGMCKLLVIVRPTIIYRGDKVLHVSSTVRLAPLMISIYTLSHEPATISLFFVPEVSAISANFPMRQR